MSMFRVTILVLVLTSVFNSLNAQKLTCPCTGSTCVLGFTPCDDGQYCFMAEIIQRDGSRRIEKGCKDRKECQDVVFCPLRAPGDKCGKFGCCDYDRCEANATFILKPSSSPVAFSSKSALKSSSPDSTATLTVVPTATKSPVAMTKSLVSKMTSEPTVQASSRTPVVKSVMTSEVKSVLTSEVKPSMTSAVVKTTSAPMEVTPSKTVKKRMSSSVTEMRPTPSGSHAIYSTEGLFNVDNRPTCGAHAAARAFGFGALIACIIALQLGL